MTTPPTAPSGPPGGQPPAPSPDRPPAEIGVIGGSGFYSFLDAPREVEVDTPFGPPSENPLVGEVSGRRVAFLPRHGRDHRFPPHQVNYRANLWALRALGVRQVLGPCAVGSLRVEHGPGDLVVPDQLIDRTWGRAHTVFDEVGAAVHVVTDHDAGVATGEGVTYADVMATFAASMDSLRSTVSRAIAMLPSDDDCRCRRSLEGLPLPFDLP